MQPVIDLRLARHGAIVLLLGLLTGFVILKLHDRGAGDAAHLVGLIGGFGMIALSALWPHLALNRAWSAAGVWSTALCMYANWFGCIFLAVGSGPADRAARVLLFAAVWLSLLATLIILFGLFRRSAPAAARDGARTPLAAG